LININVYDGIREEFEIYGNKVIWSDFILKVGIICKYFVLRKVIETFQNDKIWNEKKIWYEEMIRRKYDTKDKMQTKESLCMIIEVDNNWSWW